MTPSHSLQNSRRLVPNPIHALQSPPLALAKLVQTVELPGDRLRGLRPDAVDILNHESNLFVAVVDGLAESALEFGFVDLALGVQACC